MDNIKQDFTQEGYNKILSEIEEREQTIRKNIADDIERARQQGDLSENSAYKAAIEAKEFNETRISLLKEQIRNAEIIKTSMQAVVGLGKKVVLKKTEDGKKTTYFIVGQNEADPSQRKISLNSPLGAAMTGKQKGDQVSVITPAGEVEFIIDSIE